MKPGLNSLASLIALLMLSGCAAGTSEIPLAELEQKYAQPPSQFIDIDGLRVHYRDEGSGEPIILLHGILTSLHTWDRWSGELKKHYRVISLDLPAFGLTGDANFKYNRENYLRFLERFIAAIGLNRFVLVGNSLGGWIAWNYAIEHPAQIAKLALIDSAGFPQSVPFPMKVYTMPVIGAIATRITPRFAVKMLLKQVYAEPSRITESLVDHYQEMQLRPGNRKAAQKLFRFASSIAGDNPSGMERITMPTLLMWGEQDRWIPLSHFRQWKRALRHAASVSYADAGHMPMEEIPQRTVKDLMRFLSGLPVP